MKDKQLVLILLIFSQTKDIPKRPYSQSLVTVISPALAEVSVTTVLLLHYMSFRTLVTSYFADYMLQQNQRSALPIIYIYLFYF